MKDASVTSSMIHKNSTANASCEHVQSGSDQQTKIFGMDLNLNFRGEKYLRMHSLL